MVQAKNKRKRVRAAGGAASRTADGKCVSCGNGRKHTQACKYNPLNLNVIADGRQTFLGVAAVVTDDEDKDKGILS